MFKKITSQDLKIYNPKNNNRIKNTIMNSSLFDDIKSMCVNIENKLDSIKNEIENNDFEKASLNSRRVVRLSEDMTQLIRTIPINYGIKDAYTTIKKDLSVINKIKIYLLEPDVLHIVLSDSFPRRQQNGKIFENLDYIRSCYEQGFHEFFKDNHIKYEERVIIIYRNIFSNENEIVDDDNYDTKIITDYIAQYTLIDDNPIRCMKLYDYSMGETKHSEIVVVPFNKAENYLSFKK